MNASEQGQNYRRFPPYVAHFGMARAPFSPEPDELFFFHHPAFSQRLEMLLKMTRGEDYVIVSGEHDSGKTTLLNHLLLHAEPHWRVCRVDADPMTEPGPLMALLFGAFYPEKQMSGGLDELRVRLLELREQGLKPLLVVDNAHLLPQRSLEMAFALCHYHEEARTPCTIQTLLFTEPQIKITLNAVDPSLTGNVVTHNLFIKGFNEAQSAEYLLHRLHAAGLEGDSPFDAGDFTALHQAGQGLPGRLSKAAHKALLERVLDEKGGGAGGGKGSGRAGSDEPRSRRGRRFALLLLTLLIAAAAGGGYYLARQGGGELRRVVNLVLPEHSQPLTTPKPSKELPPFAAPGHEEPQPAAPPLAVEVAGTQVEPATGTLSAEELDAEPPRELPAQKTPSQKAPSQEPPPPPMHAAAPETVPEPRSEPADKTAEASVPPAAEPPPPDTAKTSPTASTNGTPETKAPETTPEVAADRSTPSPAGDEIAPILSGREWLLAQSPRKYTIQFLNSATADGARKFIATHSLEGKAHTVRVKIDGTERHLVLMGVYDWNRDAKAAIQKLPNYLRDYAPWSRNISHVQALLP